VTTTPQAGRLPSNAGDLALLMWEQEQNTAPGQPDPSIALWEQLKEQEGYDVASPLWSTACAYYDHFFSGDAEQETAR